MARHSNVSAACRKAQISRTTVYKHYDTDERFADKWDEAIETAIDAIELAVYQASLRGDPATARWFLSRRRPQVWGDKIAVTAEVTGQIEVTANIAETLKAKIIGMAAQMQSLDEDDATE